MSAEDAYKEKQRFIEGAERSLRRGLSNAERVLLTKVFERIIDKLDTTDGRIQDTLSNRELLNSLGRIYSEFTKPATLKTASELANYSLQLANYGSTYFGLISSLSAFRISQLRDASLVMLRQRLGLTDETQLKPGGFLQSVVEDVTTRNRLRSIIDTGITQGDHYQRMRSRVNHFLTGEDGKQGALSRRADGQLFDTLMDVDRANDMFMADDLELNGAVYVGGLIETTRIQCCKMNSLAWTRDEMKAISDRARNGKPWGGYKGDIEVFCGGYNCRHGWRWVGNSALLRMRKDLEVVPGTKQVRHKLGAALQGYNRDCA